ncbi:50S ribosomal protein L18 [Nitrosomonas sp.]|uniref:50S ribosomal protein L18 n=1 Tax=Nitrosomonas sp. TaxID=42353 RepID=UPI001D28BAD6|nr:50S ribosomal protein L18 [Nitrosomonas sp.]MBX3616435.1 50S ribosomal protein L18 [Nitrosomonas sp.]
MKSNKDRRLLRSKQTRIRIANNEIMRLSVHRTNSHIYAQLIDDKKNIVITQASTLEKDFRKEIINGGNIAAAIIVGKKIAQNAKKCGISKIAFDRSGYRYHGRVKALAEAAREEGLIF